MDPDREALRKAIARARHNMVESHSHVPCSFTEMMNPIVEAAERDLARLEGEKPKRASLGELVDIVEAAAQLVEDDDLRRKVGSCEPAFLGFQGRVRMQKFAPDLKQAAAVLRSVGEWQKRVRPLEGYFKKQASEDLFDASEALMRSLP